MLTQEQNETLTQVGPGTPMGALMRRYWVPFVLSWELPEPDCAPIEVRLLGEDLVAFRNSDGKIGLVGAACPHRRASLFWGRNEENGLRCVYHGWKYDIEGHCVDMPSEPAATNFKDKVHLTAYPCVEAGGVVWTYMGPPEHQPESPAFEWTRVPSNQLGISKVWQGCNWLQGLEGGIDSVHSTFLHRNLNTARGIREKAREVSEASVLEVVPTDYGYTYAGIRDLGEEGNYVRGYHWVMPWSQLRANQIRSNIPKINGHMWVPMDDYNTMVWNLTYTWSDAGLTADEQALRGSGNELYVDIDVANGFRSVRNMDNKFMIDRQIQKTVNFTGIMGVNTQDRAVQQSMGAICDRTQERLGTTDRAIIAARRILLNAVKKVQGGSPAPGADGAYRNVRAIEKVLPKNVDWFEALRPDLFQEAEPREPAGVR